MGAIKLIICKNVNDLGDLAARSIVDLVNSKKKCKLGLATGSAPIGT